MRRVGAVVLGVLSGGLMGLAAVCVMAMVYLEGVRDLVTPDVQGYEPDDEAPEIMEGQPGDMVAIGFDQQGRWIGYEG